MFADTYCLVVLIIVLWGLDSSCQEVFVIHWTQYNCENYTDPIRMLCGLTCVLLMKIGEFNISTRMLSDVTLSIFPQWIIFQWLLFAGKNFLRPGQMNINVATWGRLMKRALPQNCNDTNTLSPPNQISSPGKLYSMCIQEVYYKHNFYGLVQERRNSSVLAMELRLSCANPSI